MKKKILLTVAAMVASIAAVFSGVSPAAAASALPHWGPWMLCNTSGADYDVRVHVTAMTGNVRFPDSIQVRRHSTAVPPTIDSMGLSWFNNAGTKIDGGTYGATVTNGGQTITFNAFAWVGTNSPRAAVDLFRNGNRLCVTNTVSIG